MASRASEVCRPWSSLITTRRTWVRRPIRIAVNRAVTTPLHDALTALPKLPGQARG